MEIIKFFFRYSRQSLLLSLFAGVASGFINAALLGAVNLALKKNGHPGTVLVAGFAGLCIMMPLVRYFSEFLMNKTGQQSFYLLRRQLSQQIAHASLRKLEELGSHRVLATLTEDVQNITTAILILPVLCINSTLVVGCVVYLGLLSLSLLGGVLVFMVLGVLGYQFPIIKSQAILRKAREKTDRMLGHFRALTLGNKELKMHKARRREFFDVLFEETASSLRDYNIAGVRIYSAAASWGQTLVFVLVGLMIFVAPTLQKVDSALLVSCTLTILYLMTPLQVVMNSLPTLARATVSLRKIKELGIKLTEIEEEAATQDRMPNPGWKNLEFEGVTHAYGREGETSSFVLGPINVSLSRGELLFVTGGNGSGKTTFIKLLTGLYVPETGTISLDGSPITDDNRDDYREYFSAVFSDFYLFEELLGLTDVNNRSSEYLERLKLSHKVKVQEGKLSTTDLSQGQRKRLALFTAYLEDRPIYIFDEWAADQDPYFKRIFYLELLPELKQRGKTVITVTHDDKYFDVADRILKFEEGQLVSDTTTKAVSSIMQATP